MLKIKDNIPLTELKKFGFEKWGDTYKKSVGRAEIIIWCELRIVETDVEIADYFLDDYNDILYDLIKADMVEKVENRNEA
jgi:hypothetical protein